MRLIGLAVVVTLSLLLAPFAAKAETLGKVPRVGVLSPGKPPPNDAFHQRDKFEAGLRELGWTPGTNIVIEYRYAEGNLERLPTLAGELVRVPVDVIVARGLTIAAARWATSKIPIVMAADPDPVRSGFVASLARPGGNITGFSTQALDSEPKQLEFLREALPSLKRVAVLTNANSPDRDDMRRIEKVARTLQLELTEFPISGSDQLATVFTELGKAAPVRSSLALLSGSSMQGSWQRSRSSIVSQQSTICAHSRKPERLSPTAPTLPRSTNALPFS
jgi:putative ABC transport system substrate-binding protein